MENSRSKHFLGLESDVILSIRWDFQSVPLWIGHLFTHHTHAVCTNSPEAQWNSTEQQTGYWELSPNARDSFRAVINSTIAANQLTSDSPVPHFKIFIYYLCDVCLCAYVPNGCRCPWRPEEGFRFRKNELQAGCGCWELSTGPLARAASALTTGQSLWPLGVSFLQEVMSYSVAPQRQIRR